MVTQAQENRWLFLGKIIAALAATSLAASCQRGTQSTSASPACGTDCDAAVCPVAIASGQHIRDFSMAITVDATSVYWVNYGAIVKVDINGGTVTTVQSGVGAPGAIAVDASNIYWTDATAGTVTAMPRGGGNPSTLASGQMTPVGLVVDATSVYWTTLDDGLVWRMPLAGGSPSRIGAGTLPRRVVVDATNVYWTSEGSSTAGSIMKAPLAGGPATPLAPPAEGQIFGLAVDSENVYWTRYADGTVMKAPIIGGTLPTMLASGQNAPTAIATDGTSVYWVATDGVVRKVARDAGSPTTLPSGCAGWAIALDKTSVYWTTSNAIVKATLK